MRNSTRLLFNNYLARLATLSGISDATKTYTVEPSVQQKLETRMQENSEFLQKINIIPVDEQEGEKVGIVIGQPVARNTETSNSVSRQPQTFPDLDNGKYRCEKNDFDTAIKYSMLDAWAKFPDFQNKVRDALLIRQALDRITIGFNGVKYAKTSDPSTYPLREDVNKGWLQHWRDEAPQRVMSSGKASGKIAIGLTSSDDYKNLDAVVYDAVNELIDPWHMDRPDLVAICGRGLLADKYFPLVNAQLPPTEIAAAQMIISQKRIGNLSAARVPFFPANAILITPLSNLSIYFQINSRRRHIKEEPERNRIANYESSNDAYVVEDFGAGCLIENLELPHE